MLRMHLYAELKDHVVGKHVIFLAVGYVELALVLVSKALSAVKFLRPCLLRDPSTNSSVLRCTS